MNRQMKRMQERQERRAKASVAERREAATTSARRSAAPTEGKKKRTGARQFLKEVRQEREGLTGRTSRSRYLLGAPFRRAHGEEEARGRPPVPQGGSSGAPQGRLAFAS